MIAFECRDYLDNRELENRNSPSHIPMQSRVYMNSVEQLRLKMIPHQQENNLAGLMILVPYGSTDANILTQLEHI
jgi:hypothetical protein